MVGSLHLTWIIQESMQNSVQSFTLSVTHLYCLLWGRSTQGPGSPWGPICPARLQKADKTQVMPAPCLFLSDSEDLSLSPPLVRSLAGTKSIDFQGSELATKLTSGTLISSGSC